MKTQLNSVFKTTGMKIDEVNLFREMAKAFNNHSVSKCIYVDEIHQCHVEFDSHIHKKGFAKVELGDLLLLTFDKATRELRICVLQAKYKKESYYAFLNFKGDIFQWELLLKKPCIKNKSKKFKFPENILNFRTDYKSIAAYGVFYHDNISRDIEFLYTLPEHVSPHCMPKGPITKKATSFHFRCPCNLGSPNNTCKKGIESREAISTCSLDVFEEQVLTCKVGAPINDYGVKTWVLQLLRHIKGRASDSSIVDEVLEYLGRLDLDDSVKYSFEHIPSIMLVVTDSEEYKCKKESSVC